MNRGNPADDLAPPAAGLGELLWLVGRRRLWEARCWHTFHCEFWFQASQSEIISKENNKAKKWGGRKKDITGNTLRRGRGRQKRKEKKRKLFVFIFILAAKNKSAFSEIGKFFRFTKIFVSMPSPKKEIFQKGINMCHLFSLFLFFFFFPNQSSMSFLRRC